MNVKLPPLISMAIFDGIPPKEEGKDPTVFWYYPDTISIDHQLNQVGLYLTFLGFCRDFQASSDCQFIQTDSTFSCMENLGSECFVAACFQSKDPANQRLLTKQLSVFASIFKLLFESVTRDEQGNVNKTFLFDFTQYVPKFIELFNFYPYLPKLSPNLGLWILCEEALATLKMKLPTIRNAAFIYKDKLVHSCMSPNDTLALYMSTKIPVHYYQFATPKDKRLKDKFYWIVGMIEKNLLIPHCNFTDGSSYLTISTFNDLMVFLTFPMPRDQDGKTFNLLEEIITPFMRDIDKMCDKLLSQENGVKLGMSIYKDDGNYTSLRLCGAPGDPLREPEKPEQMIHFMDTNDSEFIRFSGQLSKENFLFIEKDGPLSTMIYRHSNTFIENITTSVTDLKATNL